jgi:PAS domain S-box-containing protein
MVEAKEDILDDWVKSEFTSIVLIKLDMSPEEFIEEFGSNIFDYTLSTFKIKSEIYECPYMNSFLVKLNENNIGINEALLICLDLRKVFFEYLYILCGGLTNRYEVYKKLFDDFFITLNKNLAGLIKNYNKIFKVQKEKSKTNKLLSEYKKAVDVSSIVSKTDSKGKIIYVNDAFCKISGYSKDELMGQSHNIVRHPEMTQEIFTEMWNTLHDKRVWKGMVKNRAKDGTDYVVNATIVPIVNENNEIEEYIGIRYDVTELLDAQKEMADKKVEMKESIDKAYKIMLDSLVFTIPIPAIIIDKDNRVIKSNQSFSNIFDMFDKADILEKLEKHELILDELFIKEEDYISKDDLFDFKDTLLDATDIEIFEVKIDTGDDTRVFEINIKDIHEIDGFEEYENTYLITLT